MTSDYTSPVVDSGTQAYADLTRYDRPKAIPEAQDAHSV